MSQVEIQLVGRVAMEFWCSYGLERTLKKKEEGGDYIQRRFGSFMQASESVTDHSVPPGTTVTQLAGCLFFPNNRALF